MNKLKIQKEDYFIYKKIEKEKKHILINYINVMNKKC